MKLKFDDDRIITIIYALSGIMLIGQFFGLHSLTSIAYALSFLVVFALWILQAKTLRSFDIVAIAIIVLSLINALISCSTLQKWENEHEYTCYRSRGICREKSC